jgi:hypothetical protein
LDRQEIQDLWEQLDQPDLLDHRGLQTELRVLKGTKEIRVSLDLLDPKDSRARRELRVTKGIKA